MSNSEKVENRPIWNNMKTAKVMERMLDLYESSKWHDCVFKLCDSDGSGQELVFAHNLVLASSSPVFEALCFGPLADDSPIEVPDIDPLAFKMMLKFIYTDCIEFTSVEMACNVLYASKKYLIYSLAGLAISYISDYINETNCLQVYSFASFIQEERLMKESWSFLLSHLDDISNYFSHEFLTTDLVKNLVNEEALNGGEIILYKICVMWAEAQCDRKNLEKNCENLRKVLIQADILNKIRWLTLTLEEFEEGPMKSGILTNEEIMFITKAIKLIHHVCFDCENKNDIKYEKGWKGALLKNLRGSDIDILENIIHECKLFPYSISSNLVTREKIELKKFYCHRFVEREIRPTLGLPNELKISTHIIANKSVRLTAIFLNSRILPIPQLSSSYAHALAINRDYNEKLFVVISDNNDMTIFSMSFYKKINYGTVFKIALQNPVILERSKEYKIQINLLEPSENYVFGVRNSISKFPSGLCVTFTEQANIGENGKFVEANELSIISGLELCL